MKIYLTNITFNEKPIIWTYDPVMDEATCDLILLGLSEEERDASDDILKDIQSKAYRFVSIQNGVASIPDLSEILNDFPMHPIPSMNKDLVHGEGISKSLHSPKTSPQNSRKVLTRSTSALASLKSGMKNVLNRERTVSATHMKSPPQRNPLKKIRNAIRLNDQKR